MLICIGCSWTYGNEIPETDCFNYAYPVHLGKLLNKKVVNLGMPGGSNENHLVNFITYVANNEIPKDTIAVFQTTEFVRKLGFKRSSLTNYFRGKFIKASDWVDRENYWLSLHTGAPDDKRYKDFGLSWKSYITNQMCDEELVHRNFIQFYKFQLICNGLGIKYFIKPGWIHPAHAVRHKIENHKLLSISNGMDWNNISKVPMIQHIFDKTGYNYKEHFDWENMQGPKPKKFKDNVEDYMHFFHPTKKGHKLIAEHMYEEII